MLNKLSIALYKLPNKFLENKLIWLTVATIV